MTAYEGRIPARKAHDTSIEGLSIPSKALFHFYTKYMGVNNILAFFLKNSRFCQILPRNRQIKQFQPRNFAYLPDFDFSSTVLVHVAHPPSGVLVPCFTAANRTDPHICVAFQLPFCRT